MLATLSLIGTSIAVGSFVDLDMDDGDDAIGEETFGVDPTSDGAELLDEGNMETLVEDASDTASVVPEQPGRNAMIGHGSLGAFGLDAPDVLSPKGDEGELEGTRLDLAEAPEAEAVVSDADVPEGGQVLEWTSAEDPVEITDFVPGEDILAITIIAEQGIDGVDVEIAPSADGQDGEVRANDQLLAVIRGAPDIEPEAFQFDLVDASS